MQLMHLVLDLRLGTVHADGEAGEDRCIRPQDVAERLRRPADLRRLLRGRRYEAVRVLCDEIPLNGVQAGVIALMAGARADRFELVRPDDVATFRRRPFLLRSLAQMLVGIPAEVVRTALALDGVRRVCSRPARLPAGARDPGRALYLYRPPSAMGSSTGGAAAHTSGVIGGFLRQGVHVRVLGPQMPAAADGCDFARVPVRRRYHLVQWVTLSDYSGALADSAAGGAADFVYERSVAGSYAGVAAAQRLGIPLVLEFNGSDVWIAEHWGGRPLACSPLAARLERHNLRSASLVVVLSRALAEQVAAVGVAPERILVNPVGADVEHLAELRDREPARWRAELDLPVAPTVGFIGTFGPWHGVELLPEMIEHTAREHPQARWVLIGGGPLRDRVAADIVRRRLGDRVTLTGTVTRDAAMRLLAACDVCVSPHVPNPDGTRFFGSPMKLFEYMGLGKPIVASDLEQLGEIIDHERNGLLHPPADAAAAATAVVRLLGDPALRARLGEEALHDASTRFSWNAHVERTLARLRELAGAPTQSRGRGGAIGARAPSASTGAAAPRPPRRPGRHREGVPPPASPPPPRRP
jgi:glycosyltransferase involved in cell wall biosynthesis